MTQAHMCQYSCKSRFVISYVHPYLTIATLFALPLSFLCKCCEAHWLYSTYSLCELGKESQAVVFAKQYLRTKNRKCTTHVSCDTLSSSTTKSSSMGASRSNTVEQLRMFEWHHCLALAKEPEGDRRGQSSSSSTLLSTTRMYQAPL